MVTWAGLRSYTVARPTPVASMALQAGDAKGDYGIKPPCALRRREQAPQPVHEQSGKGGGFR
jgi:hypothetical protein